MIETKIITDSLAPSGVRLTTYVLTYPRFIHAELMTHRVFSRNASSSRAIPVKKQIQMVIDNPAIPLAFTKNKAGMQGGEVLTGEQEQAAIAAWLEGRDRAVEAAQKLANLEVHKQYANRILEPWAHISVVLTATDFDNWFALRCHEAAQPEIHQLADQMYDLYSANTPNELDAGEWHLPFVTEEDTANIICNEFALKKLENFDASIFAYQEELLLKFSVARCARVSYLNHDGTNPNYEKDLELYNRLLGGVPIHASPAEHQAMAIGDPNVRSGNFRGWIQYRQTLKNQNITEYRREK